MRPHVKLHAYADTTIPGVTMHATITLWDHEDDGDLVEDARDAFRVAMSAIWATPPSGVRVYTEAEQDP